MFFTPNFFVWGRKKGILNVFFQLISSLFNGWYGHGLTAWIRLLQIGTGTSAPVTSGCTHFFCLSPLWGAHSNVLHIPPPSNDYQYCQLSIYWSIISVYFRLISTAPQVTLESAVPLSLAALLLCTCRIHCWHQVVVAGNCPAALGSPRACPTNNWGCLRCACCLTEWASGSEVSIYNWKYAVNHVGEDTCLHPGM